MKTPEEFATEYLGPDDPGEVALLASRLASRDTELIEACAKLALEGGCDCSIAPCDHDEAGEVIAQRIHALISGGATKGSEAGQRPASQSTSIATRGCRYWWCCGGSPCREHELPTPGPTPPKEGQICLDTTTNTVYQRRGDSWVALRPSIDDQPASPPKEPRACPKCHGAGGYIIDLPEPEDGNTQLKETCSDCGGSGLGSPSSLEASDPKTRGPRDPAKK